LQSAIDDAKQQGKDGLVIYYTNRCPFTEYHVENSFTTLSESKNLPLKIIKLETMTQAQSAPTPATIFSVFFNGKFAMTDLSGKWFNKK